MNYLNTNFDDEFLDIDDSDIKPIHTLTPQSAYPSSFGSTSTPIFPEPSFQYTLYPQQTGFVRGALNETFNINRATGLHHTGNNGFVMPTETLNIPLSQLDEFDFSRNTDLDFETDSPSLFFGEPSSGPAEFINPNTTLVNTSSTPIKRIYPGMHSQQAAEAKSQKQEEVARQQQQTMKGQKSLPGPSPTKTTVKDPLVELSISKVLQKMRQSSAAEVSDDEDSPVAGMSGMVRIKKDQDEMDEDELLLASEEGKKLSSKERRQLRNKVSARAFRSRRKEYIGQLEGELAQKAQEANDLRLQNQQLQEENTRLTDLTRMLLSSPSFSGFLQELSQSGLPPPNVQKTMQQQKPVQTQPQPQPMKKDVSSNAANQRLQAQHPQIGMALIPETPIDYSALQPSNGWMNTLPTNDFHVYAVTELPTPPFLDLEALSGKSPAGTGSSKGLKELSKLPELPSQMAVSTQSEAVRVDESVPLNEETFALFFTSASADGGRPSDAANSEAMSTGVECNAEENEAALKMLCSDLEDSCDELAKYTGHMDWESCNLW